MDRLGETVGSTRFRERPIELLTLSACETAQGDDRAALGLAGVAVQAGARSALGTLWSVNAAAAAELLTDFYRELRPDSVSKAVALQRAQKKLIADPSYGHPFYWSPFLLISNWL
jgi:CHAT domain-containing protein